MPSFTLTILAIACCATGFWAKSTDASEDGGSDSLAYLRMELATLKDAHSLAATTTILAKEQTDETVLEINEKIRILTNDTETYHQRLVKFKADQSPAEKKTGRSAEGRAAWAVTKVKTELVNTGGVLYVRWGRLNCDKPVNTPTPTEGSDDDEEEEASSLDKGDAKIVYTGSAATGMPTGGGGSELLCIPTKGLWLKDNIETIQKSTATIYGLEYNFDDHPFTDDGAFRNQDVPCAVCQITARSHVITISGVEQCPAGWEKEYQGYLVTGEKGQQKGVHTCLDHSPEEIKGGNARGAGGQLTPVISQCDAGLPCPPFKRGHAFDCVVCSK